MPHGPAHPSNNLQEVLALRTWPLGYAALKKLVFRFLKDGCYLQMCVGHLQERPKFTSKKKRMGSDQIKASPNQIQSKCKKYDLDKNSSFTCKCNKCSWRKMWAFSLKNTTSVFYSSQQLKELITNLSFTGKKPPVDSCLLFHDYVFLWMLISGLLFCIHWPHQTVWMKGREYDD